MSIFVKSGLASALQAFGYGGGNGFFRIKAREVQPGPRQPGDQRRRSWSRLEAYSHSEAQGQTADIDL